MPSDLVGANCYAYHPNKSGSCQGADFGVNPSQMTSTGRGNFLGLYPPVFYSAMSIFVGPNIDISVLAMRFANTLLFVGLASALYFLLPVPRRPTLIGALLLTAVPLGLFLIPSTNPSSWAIISAALLWISLLGYFESTGRRRLALGVMAAIATIMGAGARADSAVYAGVAVVAVLVLKAERTRRFVLGVILPAAILVVAVAFYLSSRQSDSVSNGLIGGSRGSSDVGSLITANLLGVPDLWVGVFGKWALGWLDTDLPAVVWVSTFGVFAASMLYGLGLKFPRKPLAAIVLLSTLWVLPTIILVQSRVLVGTEVQPRYIYPLIIMLAGIMLLRTAGEGRIPSNGQLTLAVVALAVAQSIALHSNIRRYVTGTGVGGWNLDTGVTWWWHIPVSPNVVWLVGTLSFVGILLIARRGLIAKATDKNSVLPRVQTYS